MSKIIKLTEQQFNELIDKDGSIVSGDRIETDGEIRTNYYRKTKRPQTTDDYSDETGQYPYHYLYRGFSFVENVQHNIKEDDVKENIFNKKQTSDILNKNVDVIPDMKELSLSYEQQSLENDLNNLSQKLTSLRVDEKNADDIKAIVLKQILTVIEFSSLTPQQQKEIQKLIR